MHVKICQIDLFHYSNYLILILIITLFFTKEKSPAFSQINPIFPSLFLLIKNSVIIVVFVLELKKNVNLKKICQMAEYISEHCNLTKKNMLLKFRYSERPQKFGPASTLFLTLLKGGFFSERADAFVISSNRQI